jgi:hypothetical protein
MRTPRQRRVPRALVHRGRPRGWALVTCVGSWERSRGRSRLAAGGSRLAAGGWRLAARGCGATCWQQEATGATHSLAVVVPGGEWMATRGDGMSFPLANTSYERPAPWPPSMHKCARDPALPLGPHRRHVCTFVQRWDPTLPRALTVPSWVHRCAATGAHAVGHPCERGASMERVAWQIVSCSAQRPDERLPREKGRQAPFLLAGVQGQRPAGGAGGNAPAAPRGATPPKGCRGSAPLGVQGATPPPPGTQLK